MLFRGTIWLLKCVFSCPFFVFQARRKHKKKSYNTLIL
nr:MAG TPA: hypothetical protein [Caudoviricetes sp.]